MLTLIRYFPLLVGDFVSNCDECRLIITLREIISIVYRTSIPSQLREYFGHLISYHNELYLKTSRDHLKPKFHFMTHYSTLLSKLDLLYI